MISQQHERSAEDCAVGKRDGVAVKIDRTIVRQTCDCTIAGQRPGAAGLDGHDRVVRDRCAALGIIGNIDRAGEAATVLKRQVQRRDRVDEDVAVQGLTIGGEIDLRAVAADELPEVVTVRFSAFVVPPPVV